MIRVSVGGIESRITNHVSRITRHESRITYHASRVTNHVSRITRHESRITHHASRITNHASRITPHFSHPPLGLNVVISLRSRKSCFSRSVACVGTTTFSFTY